MSESGSPLVAPAALEVGDEVVMTADLAKRIKRVPVGTVGTVTALEGDKYARITWHLRSALGEDEGRRALVPLAVLRPAAEANDDDAGVSDDDLDDR
jgi:hypothetical protein